MTLLCHRSWRSQRPIGAQDLFEQGRDGWKRAANGRQGLIVLPAPAEAPIEGDELFGHGDLDGRVLFLDLVLLPLRVDDIEEVRQTAPVALVRERDRALTGDERIAELREAVFLPGIAAP